MTIRIATRLAHLVALSSTAVLASAAGALDVKVNFQDPATVAPAGYERDYGQSYGARGGGLTYGWVIPGTATPLDLSVGGDIPGNGRNRLAPADVRLATLLHMQGDDSPQPFNGTATEGAWEIALPNGAYAVTVSAGDGGTAIDSTHSLRVEGQIAIAPFVPTATDKFRSATVNAVLTDGRLTIDAVGGFNTKINYVDISDGAPDTTPPVVSIALSGTLQSPGVYTNQATVTISASDSGGSGLASTTYRLDGGAPVTYTGPFVVSSAGSHTVTATAIDGVSNSTTTPPTAFSVVIPPPSLSEIDIQNMDAVPYNDRLVFSRINSGVTTHVFHENVVLRIKNLGTQPLTLSSLAISGGDSTYFTLPNGELTTPPGPIAPAGQYDLTVRFIAGTSATTKSKRFSTLVLTTNDQDEPTVNVQLAGFNLSAPEGGNEPSLQDLMDIFGYDTRITYAGQQLNRQGFVAAAGDEVLSPYWQRADTTKPVTMTQLAAFHSQGNTASFRWFNKGSGSQTTVATHLGIEGQSILPHRNGSTTLLTTGTFSPAALFGLGCDSERSDPALNSQSADTANGCPGPCGHHFRAWRVRDRDGKVVPNTYVVSMDYSGINYDYNDNTYIVSNLKPELQPRNFSTPGLFPGAPGLVLEFDRAYPGTLADAQAETVGFPDTMHNETDNDQVAPTTSYSAALLDIDTSGTGSLAVTTSAGLPNGSDNTQVNTLCLPFDARGGGRFAVTTTINGPITNLTTANQQAGVLFGPNQDDYAKLLLIGQSGAPRIQYYAEQNGSGANQGSSIAIANPSDVTAVKLNLIGDPAAGTVKASYEIVRTGGSGGEVVISNVVTLSGTRRYRFFDRRALGCIVNSHSGASAVTAEFERFGVELRENTGASTAISRINVGGPLFVDSAARTWSPDTGLFTPASAAAEGGAVVAIDNTVDDTLYRTYRGNVGATNPRVITFNLPVGSNTAVSARLHFAELSWGAPGGGAAGPGKRVFDVSAEGVKILDDIDLTAASGAARTAIVIPVDGITVTDGTLNLAFQAEIDYAAINAIELYTAPPQCNTASDCPGTAPACNQIACVANVCVTQGLAAGTPCASDSLACTLDVCNGSGACSHPAGNAGTTCRASAGTCDVAETCNGTDSTCPADALVIAGVQCRASAGECDAAEACSGASPLCPNNGFINAGTACTADANACTADICDGNGACTHPAGNGGTICRPAAGTCDAAESCSGVSTTCPADALAAVGTVCRAAVTDCDLAETCTGGAACPADGAKASGTPCSDDGSICTVDACNGSGTCAHTAGNIGTVCRPASGECDLAESCTGAATCPTDGFVPSGSVCTSDGNDCTDDRCNGAALCAHPTNTSPCSDGDACTAADQCSAGVCTGTDLAGQSCDTGLLGVCLAGVTTCNAGSVACQATLAAQPETCGDATDEDCDGAFDDPDACGVICLPGNTVTLSTQTKKTVAALSGASDRDKVLTKGTFSLPVGVPLTLDGIPVRIEIGDGAGTYFTAAIPAELFDVSGNNRTFKFKDGLAPYENGGLQGAKFSVKGTQVKYQFRARGLNLPPLTAGAATVTVQVGNRCYVDVADQCSAVADGGGRCQ